MLTRRAFLGALGATTLAALSACSGSDKGTDSTGAPSASGSSSAAFRIAVIAPSAEDDAAFSQSMFDAVDALAKDSTVGPVEVTRAPGLFQVDEAAAAIERYASEGYDLVIAHGSQYGASVAAAAKKHPKVSFAWGTATDTFGLPNVFGYDAAAGEGGYVLGVIAATLNPARLAAIGPVEVGDAKAFIRGFTRGALSVLPDVPVDVEYTGTFSDAKAFRTAADKAVAAGATVFTGSSQGVAGAIPIIEGAGGLWFGTQANQTSLSPKATVASQVYHWERVLRDIVNKVRAGELGGSVFELTLANGGLQIEYNDGYELDPAAKAAGDATIAAVMSGKVTVGA